MHYSPSPMDAKQVREDQKLRAVLSSYLDSYDGAPLAGWSRVTDLSACGNYLTGGVQVEETSVFSSEGPWFTWGDL